jgi:DNA-binding GntR family transcriptional regulator
METSNTKYTLHRSSLSDQVYNHIKQMILAGELKGGDRVPEERVGQQFGVSRTPIREALKRLEEYGLIRVKPRSYAEVVRITHEEAEQIALIRAHLEDLAVLLLTQRKPEQWDCSGIRQYARECQELLDAGDIGGAFERDSRLHLEIVRQTGNTHLYDIFEKLDAKVQLSRLEIHLPTDVLKRFIHQHDGLIESIRSGETTAARDRMRHHILDQLEHYR